MKRKKPTSADNIARQADKCKDVSRFFTNSGKMTKPAQRVNASSAAIDKLKFAELLLAEFPQLRDECEGYEDLQHLQMMEFALFTARECKLGNFEPLRNVCDSLIDCFALETRTSTMPSTSPIWKSFRSKATFMTG